MILECDSSSALFVPGEIHEMSSTMIRGNQRDILAPSTGRPRSLARVRRSMLVLAGLACFLVSPAWAAAILDGDFDRDGSLGSLDVDALTLEIAAGTNNVTFDLNGDGLVDLSDIDVWFPLYSANAGVPLAIALVDVDFNGLNNVADYLLIQTNLNLPSPRFTDGDLNADGFVSASDLALYTVRGGLVPNSVPEPTTLVLLGAGLFGLACQGRRRLPVVH